MFWIRKKYSVKGDTVKNESDDTSVEKTEWAERSGKPAGNIKTTVVK